MGKVIWYVGGNKGGVGKSLFSTMLMDWLFKNYPSMKLLLIETDVSGADVGCRFTDGQYGGKYDRIKVACVDLTVGQDDDGENQETGWQTLADIIGDHSDHCVVINSAATSITGVKKCGYWFGDIKKKTGHDLVTYWLINREGFCLEALGDYLDAVKGSPVHVVKNRREGKADAFSLFDGAASLNGRIEERKGKVIEFPKLGINIAVKFQNCLMPVDEALAAFEKMGDQIVLERWVGKVGEQIEKTMGALDGKGIG